MKFSKAKAAAKLLFMLLKLKIISEKRYTKLINYLTVRSLKHQMSRSDSEPNKEE